MPAVGKTTLLTVTCVWAAQHDYTLTVVLGDVVSVLNTVRDLERYGVKAAPILGQATRAGTCSNCTARPTRACAACRCWTMTG